MQICGFLCKLTLLSLPLLLSVAKQLAYLYPRFYNCSIPATFSADLPQLSRLCEGTKAPLTSEKWAEPLLSVRGEKFVSFAKSERFVDGKMLVVRRRAVLSVMTCVTTVDRWGSAASFGLSLLKIRSFCFRNVCMKTEYWKIKYFKNGFPVS